MSHTLAMRRLFEITVTTGNEVVYHSITTKDVTAVQEYTTLKELCKDSVVGLYSQLNHCTPIEFKRLV